MGKGAYGWDGGSKLANGSFPLERGTTAQYGEDWLGLNRDEAMNVCGLVGCDGC